MLEERSRVNTDQVDARHLIEEGNRTDQPGRLSVVWVTKNLAVARLFFLALTRLILGLKQFFINRMLLVFLINFAYMHFALLSKITAFVRG